jgi:hypothetical protein
MSALRIVCLIVALVGVAVCGIASSVLGVKMVQDVNGRLPEEQRLSEVGWYAGKYMRLIKEHRRLFPKSVQLRRYVYVIAIGAACLTMAAAALFW